MMRTIVLGTVLGGIVLFAWSFFSWTVLPWHLSVFRGFSNEDALTPLLLAGAKESGMYTVPGMLEGGSKEQQKAMEDKLAKGPFLFAALRPGPIGSTASMFINQILLQLGVALVATLLLMQVRLAGYLARAGFVASVGLAGALAAFLPESNWWGFSASYTAVNVADMVIGFGLAGLALAKIVPVRA